MPARRELTMRQIRQILRLVRDGVSAREIGRELHHVLAPRRTDDASSAMNALIEREAERPRHERRIAREEKIEGLGPIAAPELEHVAKSLGRHQGDAARSARAKY